MLFLPWFYRAWIVQENGLSADATLRWGSEELKWSNLLSLFRFLLENRATLLLEFRFYLTPFYFYKHYRSPARDGEQENMATS
jgi:hypothetical protein